MKIKQLKDQLAGVALGGSANIVGGQLEREREKGK